MGVHLRSAGWRLRSPGEQPYRYLDRGILANGFARVHCASCGRDELVAVCRIFVRTLLGWLRERGERAGIGVDGKRC